MVPVDLELDEKTRRALKERDQRDREIRILAQFDALDRCLAQALAHHKRDASDEEVWGLLLLDWAAANGCFDEHPFGLTFTEGEALADEQLESELTGLLDAAFELCPTGWRAPPRNLYELVRRARLGLRHWWKRGGLGAAIPRLRHGRDRVWRREPHPRQRSSRPPARRWRSRETRRGPPRPAEDDDPELEPSAAAHPERQPEGWR
jgi:hypothetical protein